MRFGPLTTSIGQVRTALSQVLLNNRAGIYALFLQTLEMIGS